MEEGDRRLAAQKRIDAIVRELTDDGDLLQLRTYLDEWAAYDVGGDLLNGGGRQRWFNNPCPLKWGDVLQRHMDWVSREAANILERGKNGDTSVQKPPAGQPAPYRIVVDHSVPIATIRTLLRSSPEIRSPAAVETFVRHHYKRGVITKREDDRLRAAHLGWAMPDGWQPWGDPFARYATLNNVQVPSPTEGSQP